MHALQKPCGVSLRTYEQIVTACAGYYSIQMTQPQTLGYGLQDSPVGVLILSMPAGGRCLLQSPQADILQRAHAHTAVQQASCINLHMSINICTLLRQPQTHSV